MKTNDNFSKFNLIPPKTKEEVATIEERDNSILYSTLLIFFAVIVYAILSIGQSLLVESRRLSLEKVLNEQKSQISSYDSIKKLNGEIFIKSTALTPIVEKDIKLTQLIEVANNLVKDVPGALVTKYSRELEGEFQVSLEMNSYSDINLVSDNSDKIGSLSDFYIKTMSKSSNNERVNAIISFTLTNI